MSDDGEKGREKPARNGRDEAGKFVEGCAPGPGRPKGSLDIVNILKQHAKDKGLTLQQMMADVGWGMYQAACKGDAACAKVLWDRVLGPVEKGLQINVDQPGSVTIGPPVPNSGDLRAQVRALLGDDDG